MINILAETTCDREIRTPVNWTEQIVRRFNFDVADKCKIIRSTAIAIAISRKRKFKIVRGK